MRSNSSLLPDRARSAREPRWEHRDGWVAAEMPGLQAPLPPSGSSSTRLGAGFVELGAMAREACRAPGDTLLGTAR